MINRITLLLFIGLAWGQDEYPYFSDMDKQLEFEQKKITIIDVKETRQFISGGGSEFNWLSLISQYQPTYVVAPIRTDFYYVTKFSITRNSKVLSEIDFLYGIGLNEEADSLILEYQKQVQNLNDKKQYFFDKENYEYEKFCGAPFGICFGLGYLGWSYEEFHAVNFGTSLLYFTGGGLLTWVGVRLLTKPKSSYKTEQPIIPQIQSFLSNQQVKSLSEAYNRKLYNDISNND